MVLLARGSVTVTAVNDGVPEKLYRAWSNNADGSGFSTTDSSGKYLGTYVGLSEPTLASQYKWTLIKGETGEPGQPGVSAYLHTAWANSANGQTGFSTSVSTDKLYIGTYSSSSSTPSQSYASYKWVRVKGLDAKFYSVIVDKSFLNRNGLSSTATETIAINSYVHEGNSVGVAAPGFFIIKEQIKQTTAGVTTYVFQEKHRSTTAVSQLNYTVSANAVTVKIEFYLTNQFNNLFAVRDIGVLMDASTDIQARVPIAQLIENINNHPSTTRISGAKMHFTNDVTFDQSFHTKLFAETGFIEKLGAYEFSADNIKTGTLSSVNGMSTMDLNTGAFSFAGGKLKYDGTTLSVIGSLTVDSFAPALKTSFNGKVDTTKLANSGQVTIHGGNITAGTLSADKITTGTLDASKVTVTNLTATNITAGTLDVGKLTLKNLSASDMQTGTLNASDVNIINLSASSIKTGTLDASSVNIDNLSANSIKGGRLDLSQGLTISDGVNDILSIGTDGKVALNASSIKIGILPVATKEDVDNIALTPGPQGTSITSVTEWYLATSAASGVTTSTAGWDKTMRTMTTTNKYLWNYKVINYSEGSPQTTAPVIIGVYGTTGATGRSINSVTKHYLATSESSGIVRTNSSFTKTIQSTTPTKKYLWTYETITWNVAPLTTYVEPFIIGTHGEKGEVGTTGVGLQSITEWYLATPLKEGVTRTTSGWKESVQTLSSVNNYLWNYEQVNYDNGTKHYTDPTIIGTFGEQGISVKGVTEYYLASPLSQGITKDTPGWTTDIQPLTPENKYLWNKEIVHYSDDAAFLDKTEILSGADIFTDKADENSVVHAEIDGKSYQQAGSGKNLFNLYTIPKTVMNSLLLTDITTNDFTVESTNTTSWQHIRWDLSYVLLPNKTYTIKLPFSILSGDISDTYGQVYLDGSFLGGLIKATDGFILTFNTTGLVKGQSKLEFTLNVNGISNVSIKKIKFYNIQLEEGSTSTEYEPPAPTPDYPIEIHSLNDFDVVSQKSEGGIIDGVEVGGRNLVLNSSVLEASGLGAISGSRAEFQTINTGESYMDLEDGEIITISFDIEMEISRANPTLQVYNSNRRGPVGIPSVAVGNQLQGDVGETINKRISLTTHAEVRDSPAYSNNTLEFYSNYGSDNFFKISKLKVERGNVATDWTPAPEDITENDNHPLIDKINLLLDEPLRSIGEIKDRLYRDSDGLWKVERNIWEAVADEGTSFTSTSSDNAGYITLPKNAVTESNSYAKHSHAIFRSSGLAGLIAGDYAISINKNMYAMGYPEGVNTGPELRDWALGQKEKGTPLVLLYELESKETETLDQKLQDKLNNLRTFKDSNYIYTILPDKSNILSENLKPTLHATFKSKAWAGNHAGHPSIIGVYGDSAKLLYLSTSADSMTFNSDGSANPASQTITFTGNLQNVLGNVLFTAIAYNGTTVVSTISLSGVGNTRTLTQAQFPASADRIQVKATLGNLEDTVTIVKLKNGADAIVGYLTNESVTLSANNAGTVSSFSSASGTFKVFEGTIDRTSSATFRVKTQTGAVATINSSSGVYSVSSMSSDSANIVFEATYKNIKIDQTLSLSKSKEGTIGPQGVSITKVDVQYYLSTSNTSQVGGVWSTTAPDWIDGRYMWSKTVTTYTSGTPTESKPVCITGAKGSTGGTGSTGATGRGVSAIVEQFYLSNSKETQTGGSWSTTMPTWSPGKYVWTRSLITYTTGTPPTSTTEPLVSSEWEAINEIQIGGRNLWIQSDTVKGGVVSGSNLTISGGHHHYMNSLIKIQPGQKIIYQVWNPNKISTSSSNRIAFYNTSDVYLTQFSIPILNGTTYQKFEFTAPANSASVRLASVQGSSSYDDSVLIKYEFGNKATDWQPAPEDVQKEIHDVLGVTNTLKNFTDTAFVDGIIERAEAQAIKEHLNTLKKENDDLLNQYSTLYTNLNLVNPAKNALLTARNNYATSYTSLVSVINNAISGDRTTAAQKTAVDNGFVSYTAALQAFTQKLSEAQTAIGVKVSADAVDGIQLGGRNLLPNSLDLSKWSKFTINTNLNKANTFLSDADNHIFRVDRIANSSNIIGIQSTGTSLNLIVNEEYTLSWEGYNYYNTEANYIYVMDSLNGNIRIGSAIGEIKNLGKSSTKITGSLFADRYSLTFKTGRTVDGAQILIGNQIPSSPAPTTGTGFYVGRIQLERGNKATEWMPSPEDVEGLVKDAQDKADLAFGNAEKAQSDATIGKTMSENLSNDSVITQVEKLELKREWDSIVKEKPSITIQATDYALQGSTEATAYNTAYTALNNSIPSLLTNMKVTSAVTRTTFNNNFANYYDKRQLLLNRIAKKAKELADVAQSSVDNLEIGGRNLLLNSSFATGSLSKWSNNGSVTFANVDGRNTAYLNTSSGIYQSQIVKDNGLHTLSFMAKALDSTTSARVGFLNAGSGASATFSLTNTWQRYKFTTTASIDTSQIFHIYSSGKRYYITDIKLEKGNKPTAWTPAPEDVEAAYTAVAQAKAEAERVLAEAYADGKVDAEEDARIKDADAKLAAAKKYAVDQILADKTIKDTRNDNQNPSWYFSNYPSQIVREFKNISTMGLSVSGQTYGILTTDVPWTGNSGGAVKQEFKVHTQVFKRSGTSTTWTPWVNYDEIAETAKSDAATAKGIADGAATSASTANSLLTDIASDSKLTATEKKAAKKEWDIIVGEKPKIDSSADTYGITTQKAAYNTAYSALNTYLSSLLSNLNTTSNIVGTTFRANFKAYYDARQDLLNAIADGAKSLVDGLEIGGTNLIIRSRETVGKIIDTSGNVINSTINSLAPDISVEVGKDYTFTKTDSGSSENYFRYGWYKADGTFISRAANNTSVFTVKAPANASILKVSYPTVSKVKVEKGNKPTSWSPAPEDVQSQIDKSVKYTDVEYYLSTSNTGLAGGKWQTIAPIWDNGKYMWSRTKVVLNDGTTDYKPSATGTNITGAKGATGSTGPTGPKGNPGENAAARNFLLESKPNSPITNSNYPIANFLLAEKPVVGETYTICIKGQLAATKTSFYAYNSGGSISVASSIVHQGNGLYYKSFNWINSYSSGVTANDTSVVIYPFTSSQSGTSTIEWITMVKGTVPLTEWVPAHEDIYQYVDDIEIGGTNLLNNSDKIHSRTLSAGNLNWREDNYVDLDLTTGDEYVFSVYLRADSPVSITNPLFLNPTNRSSANAGAAITTTWKRFIYPIVWLGGTYNGTVFSPHIYHTTSGTGSIYAKRPQLEKGNKVTDWSPSPEDASLNINKKAYNAVRYIRDWSNGSTANTGNHWYELMAFDEYGNNRALGATVTTNGTGTNLHHLTNGVTSIGTYVSAGNNADAVYLQVDLGKIYYDITEIKVWKYYNDGRTYYQNKTEVSPDGVTWYPIYDYTVEGNYTPTQDGKSIPNTIAKTHSILTGEGTKNLIDGKADQSATSDMIKSMQDAIDIALQEKTAAGLQNELSAFIKAYNAKQEAEAKEKVASENRIKSLEGREVLTDTYYGNMSAVKTFIDRTFFEGEEGLMIKNGKEGTHILINDEEISFFSDGTKTAYISQNKLSISDGTFIENLQIGNISASNETSKNHLTFRYTPPS